MTYPEGDVLPFRMTPEQRRIAVEKSVSRTPEYDGVQLFRAKLEPMAPRPKVEPAKPHVRTCSCCGGKVKVKPVRRRPPPTPPQKRWWLYYGPGRMTGGFRTKQEAKNWFLNGGR